jgi:hypothetical protein
MIEAANTADTLLQPKKLDTTFQHLDDNEDEESDDKSNSDLESLDDETKRALALVGRVETEVLVDTDDSSEEQVLHMNKTKKITTTKKLHLKTYTNTNEDTANNEEDTQDSDDVEGPRQATIIDISNTSNSETDEDSDDNLAKKMPAIKAPINLDLNQEQDTNPYTLVQARKKKGKNTQ